MSLLKYFFTKSLNRFDAVAIIGTYSLFDSGQYFLGLVFVLVAAAVSVYLENTLV